MKNSTNDFRSIRVIQGLFFLNAAIWVLVGGISLTRMANQNQVNPTILSIVAILMFGNAAAMLWSGMVIGKGQKLFYTLSIALVCVNILLTVTDQFGFWDLVTLLIDLLLLALLIVKRKTLTTPRPSVPVKDGQSLYG